MKITKQRAGVYTAITDNKTEFTIIHFLDVGTMFKNCQWQADPKTPGASGEYASTKRELIERIQNQ